MQEFLGYHGTPAERGANILKVGFIPSESTRSRYGKGTYFYIDGLSPCPKTDALNWLATQCHQRFDGAEFYIVFTAKITADPDRVWDTRTPEGHAIYTRTRRMILDILENSEEKPDGDFDFLICEEVVEAADFQVVIGEQIAHSLRERKLKLSCHIPNVTVLCVTRAYQNCIDCVSVLEEGRIER